MHKKRKNTAKGRHRVLSPDMSFHVYPGYKPCIRQSAYSYNPIPGHMIAIKKTDPWG